MSLDHLALSNASDLPIRCEGKVHEGKVRAVYWLTHSDSSRLIGERQYAHSDGAPLSDSAQLGVMVTSDRISAFDVNWKGEDGLCGVPGKGAVLNAISKHWFERYSSKGFAGNHILDAPHPLVWIVQRANPIIVESVARDYITGSMWRDYESGQRNFGGSELPDGLVKNQKLQHLLLTPTTKGVLTGIEGVPEKEDAALTWNQIFSQYSKFGFNSVAGVELLQLLTEKAFNLTSESLASCNTILVDTKFEFGYVDAPEGRRMIYIDEACTPDSSRFWDAGVYLQGKVIENSKEGFRQHLLGVHGEVLTKGSISARQAITNGYRVPVKEMMGVSDVYGRMARNITGIDIPVVSNAREGILDALNSYGILN